MRIEVAYAKPEQQTLLSLELPEGSTAEAAILASGILDHYPEIDLHQHKIGIFGKLCKLDQCLKAGDRVEIYRPLLIDPKEARRNRAARH